MKKIKRTPVLTIGIPTCYGGQSLVDTVISIKKAVKDITHEIIIVADRTPLTPEIKKQLVQLNVSLTWNKTEGSQFKKLKQIILKASGELFIFTQDDITFDTESFAKTVAYFQKNKKITMAGLRVLPLPSLDFLESCLASMIRIVDGIAIRWHSGKNYLAASGRCLVFRTDFMKKFEIKEHIVNGDMYLYLENKRLNGSFGLIKTAKVYIRPPQKLKDQIGPSSRYQFSREELENEFSFPIAHEYKIPLHVFIHVVLLECVTHPIQSIGYMAIFIYTRINKQQKKVVSNPVWKVDASTKITSA